MRFPIAIVVGASATAAFHSGVATFVSTRPSLGLSSLWQSRNHSEWEPSDTKESPSFSSNSIGAQEDQQPTPFDYYNMWAQSSTAEYESSGMNSARSSDRDAWVAASFNNDAEPFTSPTDSAENDLQLTTSNKLKGSSFETSNDDAQPLTSPVDTSAGKDAFILDQDPTEQMSSAFDVVDEFRSTTSDSVEENDETSGPVTQVDSTVDYTNPDVQSLMALGDASTTDGNPNQSPFAQTAFGFSSGTSSSTPQTDAATRMDQSPFTQSASSVENKDQSWTFDSTENSDESSDQHSVWAQPWSAESTNESSDQTPVDTTVTSFDWAQSSTLSQEPMAANPETVEHVASTFDYSTSSQSWESPADSTENDQGTDETPVEKTVTSFGWAQSSTSSDESTASADPLAATRVTSSFDESNGAQSSTSLPDFSGYKYQKSAQSPFAQMTSNNGPQSSTSRPDPSAERSQTFEQGEAAQATFEFEDNTGAQSPDSSATNERPAERNPFGQVSSSVDYGNTAQPWSSPPDASFKTAPSFDQMRAPQSASDFDSHKNDYGTESTTSRATHDQRPGQNPAAPGIDFSDSKSSTFPTDSSVKNPDRNTEARFTPSFSRDNMAQPSISSKDDGGRSGKGPNQNPFARMPPSFGDRWPTTLAEDSAQNDLSSNQNPFTQMASSLMENSGLSFPSVDSIGQKGQSPNQNPFARLPFGRMLSDLTSSGVKEKLADFFQGSDLPTAQVKPREAVGRLKDVSKALLNMSSDERERRAQQVMWATTILYVLWASLIGDNGGAAGHFIRFAAVYPLLLARGYQQEDVSDEKKVETGLQCVGVAAVFAVLPKYASAVLVCFSLILALLYFTADVVSEEE